MAISCRHLQQIAQEKNHYYPDGVYKINPTGSQEILAYCDLSRDGGGWTLLVASHTNSWTAQNVILRNANSPTLHGDYSILKHADSIKDNINVAGLKFEYRLEAQSRGSKTIAFNLPLKKRVGAWDQIQNKAEINELPGNGPSHEKELQIYQLC